MRLLLYALFWKNKVNKNAKIFVAGHKGLVGSAIIKQLQLKGYSNLVLRDRTELDLLDQIAVNEFFRQESPEYVIDCAAKVGGIKAKRIRKPCCTAENTQVFGLTSSIRKAAAKNALAAAEQVRTHGSISSAC